MANMPGGAYRSSGGKADNDIYTALVIIACCVVGLAVGFVSYKAIELLGSLPSFKL
ncbi:MAG TPA: hypothetical protein P5081_16810 [Phycisphaerae bacterium]|nr:hypothetical protein [Phycisphaerae bacterium]HRW54533.1 hypothetical protein [Phycisphaerae bacterium]